MFGKLFYKLLSESELMEIPSQEKKYKFKTTLVEDLFGIADEMGKRFEECGIKVEDMNIWRALNEVGFVTRGLSEEKVRKYVKLDSLEVKRTWSTGNIRWEANYREFNEKFESSKIEYGKHLRELANFVKGNCENTAYHYMFNKYEDSVNIVLNTIKESKQENNGNIPDEILEKSKIIINKLEIAIDEKKEELESVKYLQYKAVKQSLVGRLNSELEFIEKFLEV